MSRKFFRRVVLGIFIIFLPLSLGSFSMLKQNNMPKIENFQTKEFKTEKGEVLVGIISDTHISSGARALPKEIFEIFKDYNPPTTLPLAAGERAPVDLIIHAGDIENLETLKELEKIAPVFAVEGNMDGKETKEELPEGISLKIYNWKIGIIHSPFSFWLGSHFNLVQEKVAQRLAEKENFDILIFGHTHRPFLKELNFKGKNILLINPGSATIPFFTQPSVAILKINPQNFEAKIIKLE